MNHRQHALLGLLAAIGGACAGPAEPADFAITHVSVVDGRAPTVLADRTVLVRGNRIVAEGPADGIRVASGTHVIDGRGAFLIPGLWDMHVHTVMPGGARVLPLYLANGVTGVRDMAGDWATLSRWRREIRAGTRVGPRMVASGPYLEGGDVPIPHLLVAKPEDAQPAVDSLIALGVDFIKVHSQLDRERYFAIARAARARGIAFAGHVPRSVTTIEASDAGQRSIEHLLTIPNQCTPEEVVALAPRFPVQSALGRCETGSLDETFAHLVKNGTYVVPTLVAAVEVARWPERDLPGDEFGAYLPDSLRDYVASIFPMPDDVPPGADAVGLALLAKRIAIVGALRRAGVPIMAGTDAPLRNSPPGFGLHEELRMMTEGGLTPFEALSSATIVPARFLGAADSLGTVEAGRIADLVLLEADPLVDIANARRVRSVFADGRLYDVRSTPTGPVLEPVNAR